MHLYQLSDSTDEYRDMLAWHFIGRYGFSFTNPSMLGRYDDQLWVGYVAQWWHNVPRDMALALDDPVGRIIHEYYRGSYMEACGWLTDFLVPSGPNPSYRRVYLTTYHVGHYVGFADHIAPGYFRARTSWYEWQGII